VISHQEQQQGQEQQQANQHSTPPTNKTMSIVSGSGAAKLTDDVRTAVLAISRRFDFATTTDDHDADSTFVPFCVIKLVEGSQSSFTLDTVSAITNHHQHDAPSTTTTATSTSAKSVPATWASLVASLPSEQCRMAVAQVPWRAHSDGVVRSRLVFLLWAPDFGPSTKDRMLASMFSKGVKHMVDQWGAGMSLPVQAATVADLDLADIEDKIRAKATVK
jgi:hypothetical protein